MYNDDDAGTAKGKRRGRVKRLTLPCGGDGLLRGLGLNYVGHSRPHDDDDVLSQWTVPRGALSYRVCGGKANGRNCGERMVKGLAERAE